MTLTDALSVANKATDRSLKSLSLAAIRTGVRVGAAVAPRRTAHAVASRFFRTQKPALARMRFEGTKPVVGTMPVPDGSITTYRWGEAGRPTALLVHGWNGWAQQLERFVAPLQERGFAVLAFDHVAHGLSDGEQTTLPSMIRSVERVLLAESQVAAVVAHSLGAAAVASVLSSTRSELNGAVLIAPPSDPRPYLRGLARMLGAPRELMTQIQEAAERTAGVPMARLVVDPWITRRIRTPLMIVHDVTDEEVPISNGYAYTTGTRTRLLVTDGLGHRRILRDRHVVEASSNFVSGPRPMLQRVRLPLAA
jgi:pimeloyl-ACP methyl ester carboxylesterase